jgi:hypothetical protein
MQISISINRIYDDCGFTYNKKDNIYFYIYPNQAPSWWNKQRTEKKIDIN